MCERAALGATEDDPSADARDASREPSLRCVARSGGCPSSAGFTALAEDLADLDAVADGGNGRGKRRELGHACELTMVGSTI